jgi:hypothetical protein
MPDLRIQTAIDNGDWSKDNGQDNKELTLEQAINPTVIKAYYEQFKKEFNRPSVFEKNRGQDK